MFKIFPATLINGQKVPLIKGWNELATDDPVQIKLWQDQFRDRITFWGMPCGIVNGVVALDVDVKKVNGFESLKKLGYEIPNTVYQQTPSGGMHFFFRAKEGVHYPNTVNSKLGLDTRGDRGWVAVYNFTNNVPLAECPDWFSKLAPEKEQPAQNQTTYKIAPEIVDGIFTQAIDNVRNAPTGESNDTLNRESFKIGQLVASGSVTREVAERELYNAAKERGKPDYESRATIKSGLDGGQKSPLICPFPDDKPVASFTLPEVPGLPERWTPRHFTRADLLNTSKLRKPQLFRDWCTEDIHLITADGGTGKSTLMLNEAIALALGEPFLGHQNMQRGKTLFITGEDTAEKLGAMIGAITVQMGLHEPGEENRQKVETILDSVLIKKDADLCLITKDRNGFLYPNKDAFARVLQAVEDIKPKKIIFDPISSFWGSESALNDMNKAVTRFMSDLVDKGQCCVEMINHMGKSSSSSKDVSQFAGRGGSGLPSNSRVCKVLHAISEETFKELTGLDLTDGKTAIQCTVNKFTDGSPLLGKPFIIVRDRYMFSKVALTIAKAKELEKQADDGEKIFYYVKQEREKNKFPTRSVIIGQFMNNGNPMSKDRIKRALDMLCYSGHLGEKLQEIENPNVLVKERVLVVTDLDGKEISNG